VLHAEIQTAPVLAAVGFATAHVGQATIDAFPAAWMVTRCRDAIADVTPPIFIVAY
jgi:hypothetical protein